ncbi:dipeptidase PepV [Hazenella sp. IB182357]|uniref:Dipeptidase PepV n=1 Tax=Polycladospora coralii TaxID=2771432 RepID=A0A926NAA9_9BACL|nr:dipeptidase PepV [Polycladospora coralii]MBD1373161.1 dipeptidase PepV [Polycladospora coralii]
MNWKQEVESRKEQMIADLKDFLAIESTLDLSTAEVNKPFGKKVDDALQYMLDLGGKDGFHTKNVDGYAGHIEYGTGDELIGVLAHVDVVPAGDGWTSPPFSPEVRTGKLYARGAIDDKGPGMAAYYALKIVKESGLPLSKRVRLILGTDEETNWRCMKHYFSKEDMPSMGFTPDADFPIITAEKGLLDILLTGAIIPTNISDSTWVLEQFEGGQRVNMVPDVAICKLTGEGDVFDLKEKVQDILLQNRIQGYAEEADDHVKICVHGRAYHGSEPEKGLNAVLELAKILATIDLDSAGSAYVEMINRFLTDSFFGEKMGLSQADDVVGKLTVNAGVFQYAKNEESKLQLNIRYPLSGDKNAILSKVDECFQSYGLKIVDVDHKAAHYCEPDHPLVKTLSSVYEEQTGKKAELLAIGGGTYARALNVGVAFGPLFPGKEETAHQKDEFIELDDLFQATALYAQAIYELAK